MSDIDNIFDRAAKGKSLVKNRQALTIDYVPDKLPFRDKESATVAETLSTVLRKEHGRPSNLLLFGEPGTGKTAVIKKVMGTLKKKANELGIDVTVPMINAKTAKNTYKVMFDIAEEIGINKAEKKVPFTGISLGEGMDRVRQFIQEKELRLIIVIDEIDTLIGSNGDDMLYTFTRMNEQMSKGGFVSIIGISNDLSFKEKLDARVRSSLSEEEMVFNPYTVEQLRQILLERAKLAFNEGAITTAAINLCAAMAGREHGDARKAIHLLQVAADMAEMEHHTTKVEEKHIRASEGKIEKDVTSDTIKAAPTHTKFMILAITKSKNGNTGDIYDIYTALCKQAEQTPLTQRRLTQIISKLELQGLVTTNIVNQGRHGRSQIIKITVPLATVKNALKDDPMFVDLTG